MPAASDPQYAVVVATHNRGSKITPLIESILRSEVASFEVVIVDQSSNDEKRRAAEPFAGDPRIRYVHSDIASTSRARNLGFKMTSAPIIAITDDDCTVPPDWLTRMGEPFSAYPQVGVVYCNVDPVPGPGPGHTPNIRFAANRVIAGVRGIRAGQRLWMGAGMAIRRAMLEEVRGFDENLGPGEMFPACEDNDIAWRGLVQGWWVYETTDVAVVHDGFRSLEQLRAHVTRDFYGIGGTLAKYLKAGHLPIAAMLVPLLYRFGVVEPATDVLRGRVPRGLRRPYMLVRGVVDGLRAPLDRRTLCYLKNPVSAG